MQPDTRDRLKEQLVHHEGLRTKLYRDTTGNWTIGVGRNLTARGITPGEAMTMLANDITLAEMDLAEHFPWTDRLDDVRQMVLTELCFNMGPFRLGSFTKMLAAAERGDYETAACEMEHSVWATQVKGRAVTLARQMRTGAL